MGAIKWVNDTFVPWGLKPIEDFPDAVPGQGNICVLAKVLKDGFPELENVQVGSTSIDFNAFEDEVEDVRLKEMLRVNEYHNGLNLPQDIREFIRNFDYGEIPELIDDEQTIATIGEWEAHNSLKIGCTNDKECLFCFPDGADTIPPVSMF